MFKPIQLFLSIWYYLLLTTLIGKFVFAGYFFEQFASLGLVDVMSSVLWGIRFDIAISMLFAFLIYLSSYLLYRIASIPMAGSTLFLVVIALFFMIMTHGSDILYYAEAGRHMGYELTEGLNSAGSLLSQLFNAHLVFLLLHLLWFALTVTVVYLNWRPIRGSRTLFDNREFNLTNQLEFNLVIIFFVAVVAIRGGTQNLPLEPIHVQAIGSSQKATLALNGFYNAIYSSLSGDQIKPEIDINVSSDEIEQFEQMTKHTHTNPPSHKLLPNVVIVFLESWSSVFMNSYGGEDVTTPFFDTLRERSISSGAMFAGGHRTTEGMFASMCSWQNPLGKTISQTQLQNYSYNCLPHILTEHGYSSLFVQGTNANTSGTGAFANLIGFKESVGRRDYQNKLTAPNSWGYHDADIYHYVLNRIDAMDEPFLIGINTNSTHDVEMPEGFNAPFGTDSSINTYKSLLNYADQSLSDFYNAIRTRNSDRETIVVFMADHAGPGLETTFSRYLIPFLINDGKDHNGIEKNSIVSQRDIAPTVLDLAGIVSMQQMTGSSLNTNHYQGIVDYYHQGILGWVYDNRLLEISINHPEQTNCHAISTLKPLQITPDSCNSRDIEQQHLALTFTRVSQQRLFNGKLESTKTGQQHNEAPKENKQDP